jgi:hypothetical protein
MSIEKLSPEQEQTLARLRADIDIYKKRAAITGRNLGKFLGDIGVEPAVIEQLTGMHSTIVYTTERAAAENGRLDQNINSHAQPVSGLSAQGFVRMNRKRIAREWLLFLAALTGWLFILVPCLHLVLTGSLQHLGKFYEALFKPRQALAAWLFALAPYLLIQLVRSVVWALRTIKSAK